MVRGPHAGDANADIVASIVERVRARVLQGACTFMVKVKVMKPEENYSARDTLCRLEE